MAKPLLVVTVCLVGLLSNAGASIPYPLLPPLFADGQVNALNNFAGLPPKLLLGVALAINPLGLLIGTALLGPLSDRYGRRNILLGTTLISALGHLATAASLFLQNYPLFLLTRFLTGLAEGNNAVARAMLSDELQGENRLRAFAWFNGAMTSGWLVGPLLTGATIHWGDTAPFIVAAVILVLTVLMGLFVFPKNACSSSVEGFWHNVRQHHSFTLLRYPSLRQLFTLQLTYTLGVTAFYQYYPLWLVEFLGMDVRHISLTNAVQTIIMSATSFLVAQWGSSRLGADKLHHYALLAAACIALTPLTGPMVGLVMLVAFGVPHTLYNTILPVHCSERFAVHGQGAVMGLLGATFCVSNVLVSLVGAGVTLFDTRLMLLLGAAASAWAGWRIAHWAKSAHLQEARA
ncbi:MFS transporter [Chromobacterium haemolyticum]|uniref:MFS transporter n=1 Tax=Chromobacterium haemolyticum TaxID=394935 RepID=UPI000D30B297|nr:MFS transporter [Chromobacterium haemolyticum]PTU71637.1 MFS transporter [Chromobacterium haemolyticum]